MPESALRAPSRVVFSIALLSAIALALVKLATPYGLGTNPDSQQYMYVAESLLRGDGLRTHWLTEGTQPLTQFPPGLPVALAIVGFFGPDASSAAAIVNGIALVATAFLTFGLARKAAGGSTGAGLAAVAAVILSRDVIHVQSMVWSEPLYLALAMGTLSLVARAIERNDTWSWIAAGLVAGLAAMVRYSSPGLIGAAALALLLIGHVPWRARLLRSVGFGLIATVPLLLLILSNVARSGSATDRTVSLYSITFEDAQTAAMTVYYWVVALDAPPLVRRVVGIAFLVVFAPWLWFFVRRRLSLSGGPSTMPTRAVLALFPFGCAGFLLFTMLFVDAGSTPNSRHLGPMVPMVTILAVALIADSWRGAEHRKAAIALSGVLASSIAISTGFWIMDSRQFGLGYSGPGWLQLPLLARVRELDGSTLIVSNQPAAIWLHAGREAVSIPALSNPNNLQPNAEFERQMREACRAAAGGRHIVYVHFTRAGRIHFLPTLAEVRRRWPLATAYTGSDGVLEVFPPSTTVADCDRPD
jgi:4-amino-4-deoxy-L-arabinose transferase-like glycosyltransferase